MPRARPTSKDAKAAVTTDAPSDTPQRRSKRAAAVKDEAPITPPPRKGSKRAPVTVTTKATETPAKASARVKATKGAPEDTTTTPERSAAKKGRKVKTEVKAEEVEDTLPKSTPAKNSRKRKGGVEEAAADGVVTPPSSRKKAKLDPDQITAPKSAAKKDRAPKKGPTAVRDPKDEPVDGDPHDASDPDTMRQTAKKAATAAVSTTAKKPRAPRKTAEQKAAEAVPVASRTHIDTLAASSTSRPKAAHYIGAHVSASGGVHNALTNAVFIGGNALALFLKSQRKWENPPLKPEVATQFKDLAIEHKYSADRHVLPHGSYLVNLAAEEQGKAEQAYTCFLDDLQRCKELGIGLYNFHPGNTNGRPKAEAIARIARQLNRLHKATKPKPGSGEVATVTLLENMAAAPSSNTIGGRFEDLRDVIALVEDKSRVGVCFDTCHGFAAGCDIRTPEGLRSVFTQFDEIVGPQYLRAVHLNDSKGMLSSHRDLHQNIGLGFLGLRAFHALMNEERFRGMPMVLETPIDRKDAFGKDIEDKKVWAGEIKLLESLVGMDVEGKDFEKLEKELAVKGEAERGKLAEQFQRKVEKDAKSPKKKQAKVETDDEDD
ncbi:MAG: hypothetical protein M1828_006962 [Chrysothrix sp. TS-e1954]|nr:MAG: hypothetical protein M1828_006962 [Chrysothrix sp. TS-e1954]